MSTQTQSSVEIHTDYCNVGNSGVCICPARNRFEVIKTEVRVVDLITGGEKGSKPARFDMIPVEVLWELAEHYGKGEAKYPSDENGLANWRRGYGWQLSYAALQRHIHQWAMGESLDAETGSSHLVAAIWHLFALRWFELHGKGRDFRDVRLHGQT